MGRRRHAFIGWNEDAIWLERNDSTEWKLPWSTLAGMRESYTQGAVILTVGSELIDDAGKPYRLPVHWRTGYPPGIHQAFDEVLKRLPEGSGKVYASCPRPTTAGAYRVLGIGVILTVFGAPAIIHFLPSSPFEGADPMLLMTQSFSLMGGIGTLGLGLVDFVRARRGPKPGETKP